MKLSRIMKYSNLLDIETIFFSLLVVIVVSMLIYNVNFKISHNLQILTLLIQVVSIVFALTGIGYFYIFKKIDEYKNKFLKECQETIFPLIDSQRNLLSEYLKIIDEVDIHKFSKGNLLNFLNTSILKHMKEKLKVSVNNIDLNYVNANIEILNSFNITYNSIKRNLKISLIYYFVALFFCFIPFITEYLSIVTIILIISFIAHALSQFYSSWNTTEREFEMMDKVIIVFSTLKQSKN